MATAESLKLENSRGFNNKSPGKTNNSLYDQFDQFIKEQDENLQNTEQFKRDYLANITDSIAYQIELKGLECPNLENNPIFQKLKHRINQFFIAQEEYRRFGPNKQQIQQQQKSGVDFTYKIALHRSLKRLLREVTNTKDKQMQLKNLGKVYTWYFAKLESIGQMTSQDKEEEEIFMNPGKIEEIQRRNEQRETEKRALLLNEDRFEEKERKMYEEGERTIHRDIPPAKDRIVDYKRKSFGKLFTDKSGAERPLSGVTSSQGLGEVTTQAQSVFEEDERSVYSHPFSKFYSTGDPVVYKTQNRFEGKSNYYSYYPTTDMVEQKVEKMWFENRNRKLQEKRRDEELKQHIKEWSNAKERLEGEIQRKKEHQLYGTNFEQARGFVRKNWSSKNFNPENNPLLEESSEEEYYDEEDEEAEVIQESINHKQESKRKNQYDYDEDDDNLILEDEDEDGDEQQETMNRMKKQKDQQDKENTQKDTRNAKSAYPRTKNSKQLLSNSSSTQVIDLTKDQVQYGMRPNTAIQLKQIQALNDFNKALPKRKQNLAFPMIQSTNIGTKQTAKKDHKKKTVELLTYYTPIGLVDDYFDPKEAESSKYSMQGKIRHLSVQSAKHRVEELRKHQGPLINANIPPIDESNLDNIFVSSSKGAEAYTLSLYNRADKYKRPLTAPTQNNWFKKYEKLQPVPEEEENPKDTRLPDFKEPPGATMLVRGQIDGYRLEQINEIDSIKEKLAKDNCALNMVTLQRAILMPEELEYRPGLRKYPTIGDQLMVNPFPKKKKKKKGKKKKKSKKK